MKTGVWNLSTAAAEAIRASEGVGALRLGFATAAVRFLAEWAGAMLTGCAYCRSGARLAGEDVGIEAVFAGEFGDGGFEVDHSLLKRVAVGQANGAEGDALAAARG